METERLARSNPHHFDVERHSWGSGSTRPCAYSLAIGDVAFADFGLSPDGALFLLRISFDSYGCCAPDPSDVSPMEASDSGDLIRLLESGAPLGTDSVRAILRRYFEAHRAVVWEDALIEWRLVSA